MSDETKQLNKARQAIVDRVLSRLDEGAMPWDNGMQGVSVRPYNAITGKPYRGMNVLSLMLTFKSDPRWITFNQATEAGYAVKKGARGVPIELYKTIDKRTGKDADIAAIKEEIKDMTFEERQAFKKENLRSFAKSYYVFNASDVHGIEPYVPKELTPTDISARNERIERVIANSQAPIYYDGNGRNYYTPTADEIHLTDRAAFKSDEFFYNTALHEMAHSTGHSSRLNRPGGTFGSKAYAREELVAEISSVLTAAEFGLNHSDRVIENSAEYVRSWAEDIRENPQTLIDAAFDASKATDYICDFERQREQTQEKTQKESGQDNVSPVYKQYAALQDKYPDAVIVTRLGDFYEVMGDSARTVSDELGLTLTGRDVGLPERVPMCGFPYHVAEQYIEKILENHSVTVVESTGEEKYIASAKAEQATPIENYANELRTQKESLQSSVKEWYSRTFSTDELANELNANVTFGSVRDTIMSGKNIYAELGSEDSSVRERVFGKLADILDMPYKAVYNAWIENSESAETRKERYKRAMREDFPKDFANDFDEPTPMESRTRTTPQSAQSEQQKTPPIVQHAKPLMINFYAGPSAGKSVAALELTAALKKAGYNVEYVSEFAKDLVLEGRTDELKDQEFVTDGQYQRFDRIRNSTDIIVTDSPVLLGLVYGEFNGISEEYKKQIRGYYDSFDNFNMLMTRPKDATFQTEGRVHNEKQSLELDGKIKSMLDTQKVFYGSYKRDDIAKTVERIGTTYNRLYGEQKGKTQKEKAADIPPAPPKKPYEFKTNIDNIPDAMKALPNWIAFRTHEVYDEKKKEWKLKKVPITPNQPRAVSSSQYLKWADHGDPNTWSSFDNAVAFAKRWKLDGLAFAVQDSGMTCVDLDHHLVNGIPTEFAQKFIDAAGTTYAEKSVSGTGLHIFYTGQMPPGIKNVDKDIDLEAYDKQRFISMTGNLYGNATKEVLPSNDAMTELLKDNLKRVEQHAVLPSKPSNLSDNELIELVRAKSSARDLRDFEAMWRGEDILNNRNETDLKLCGMFAFYSNGDVAQVERCFKASGLYRPPPEKSAGYVHRTAQKACDGRRAEYDPKSYAQRMNPNRIFAKQNNKSSGSGGNSGNGSSGRGSSGR